MISFKTIYKDKDSKARIGELQTPHGVVQTPAFVPVGTQATVKSLTPDDLRQIGTQILFGNTYHLHLRPGEDIIEEFGGLGKFMQWDGVTMTDSGGFQVFSLARDKKFGKNFTPDPQKDQAEEKNPRLVTITEDGVEFRSHLDGSSHLFTPEQSIAIQKRIGADILLSFDDCTPFPVTYDGAKSSMERTHRWLDRSLTAFKQKAGLFDQALYGIVQGSIFQDLREESARFVASRDFDGIAIGGVSVGESKTEMQHVVDWTVPYLPDNKIRHLLGVGDVDDIFEIIERGIDTFDCVTPTRLGRVGHIFVHPPEGTLLNRFRVDITKSAFQHSTEKLDMGCDCYVCATYTRGYIHHLFRAKELLAYRLATYHNLHVIINLTKSIRKAIQEDRYLNLKMSWLDQV